MPVRLRKVSITAATTATVRITAANSNGSRNSVYRLLANQVRLELSAACAAALSAGNGVALRALTPIKVTICANMATAMMTPSGMYLTHPSRRRLVSMSSIITTNRNSTITAPT